MASVDAPSELGLAKRILITIVTRPWRNALLAGLGGALAIGVLAVANEAHVALLLIPPFGASCVLVFGVPASPFARPRNVIGGHLISAAMGLTAVGIFGPDPLGIAAGVGLAIASMMLTDTVHPPAGANPIVVAILNPGWSFLLAPVLIGAAVIVILGAIYNRLRQSVTLGRAGVSIRSAP